MGTWTADPYHDAWEGYMEMERIQLAERASGKLRRAIGGKLAWESSEELERIAADDERRRGKLRKALGLALPGESSEQLDRIAERDRLRAERGLVSLEGADGKITYKHIDDLGREDMIFILAAERVEVWWLKERLGCMRKGAPAPPVPPHLA